MMNYLKDPRQLSRTAIHVIMFISTCNIGIDENQVRNPVKGWNHRQMGVSPAVTECKRHKQCLNIQQKSGHINKPMPRVCSDYFASRLPAQRVSGAVLFRQESSIRKSFSGRWIVIPWRLPVSIGALVEAWVVCGEIRTTGFQGTAMLQCAAVSRQIALIVVGLFHYLISGYPLTSLSGPVIWGRLEKRQNQPCKIRAYSQEGVSAVCNVWAT